MNSTPYLYLVTDRKQLKKEQFFDIIMQAVKGGVRCVQLREKNTPTRDFLDLGKALKSLLEPYKIPLIINDQVDIALAVKADGVHLGQDDMCPIDARKILKEKAIIGLSVETMEQALSAEKMPINYIAASPVFSSVTKVDTAKPWGLEKLKELKKVSCYSLVAIGGIDLNNVKAVCKAGADGIAVVSAIFNAPDPYQAAQDFCQEMKR